MFGFAVEVEVFVTAGLDVEDEFELPPTPPCPPAPPVADEVPVAAPPWPVALDVTPMAATPPEVEPPVAVPPVAVPPVFAPPSPPAALTLVLGLEAAVIPEFVALTEVVLLNSAGRNRCIPPTKAAPLKTEGKRVCAVP
jgi:hypothetical protein